jgi:hypothetical protein
MFTLALIAIVIWTCLAHRASQNPPTRTNPDGLDQSG